MGTIQAITYPTVDADGFASGTLADAAITARNADKVVTQALPEGPLGQWQNWRWQGGAWSAATDYRAHTFYNPDNTGQMHSAVAYDDAPPSGWVYWAPGENKIVGADEATHHARTAKWTDIKLAREAALAAPLQTAYGTFDATPAASANIIKSVLLANNLSAMGQPVAIDFTLANNTVVTLDAAAMIAVGLTLAGREQTIRAKATTLRAQIEAATTQAQVEAVVW